LLVWEVIGSQAQLAYQMVSKSRGAEESSLLCLSYDSFILLVSGPVPCCWFW
jgi:hypothetical protein